MKIQKGYSMHPQKNIKAKKAVYECDDIFLDGAENLHRASPAATPW